jgi:succinate-acetate transporter protein
MAVFAEDRPRPTLVELSPAADPAPLGLAAFALTTFMLSGHNASFIRMSSGSASPCSTAG